MTDSVATCRRLAPALEQSNLIRVMKSLPRTLALLALLFFTTAPLYAGPFHTEVLFAPKIIDVPLGRVLSVVNFTQNATPATNQTTGTLAVQKGASMVIIRYAVDISETTTEPLNRDTVITGPATITVTPIGGNPLFLSYKLLAN
jgi:hypothetical protein